MLWLEALDGTEPLYAHTPGGKPSNADQTYLDESGFNFMQDCISALDQRGLEDQVGLLQYVAGYCTEQCRGCTVWLAWRAR